MKKILLSFCFSLCLGFSIHAQTPDTIKRSFQLGEVVIKGSPDTTRSNTLNSSQISRFNRLDVSRALNLLSGITLSAVGPRNESGVNVRGFDLRQVPIYLDGMPLYVPYDGYVDLARYTTFNLASIQVAKGYSSVLYGPNAIGGAINLVTRQPVKPFEANVVAGWLSGGYRLNTNLGGQSGKFYYQLSASQLKQNWFPLSEDFQSTTTEDGGHRGNSYRNDVGISGKIGFTPTKNQEYAIGYSYQRGKKGNPVYTGNDTQNSLLRNPRFWQWPRWDTESIYFLSNNKLNDDNTVKTRAYYNTFKNQLNSYDDASFSNISRPYAFRSIYNDHTLGASAIFENTSLENNSLSLAAHYKKDVHREYNIGEPSRRSADNNLTFGLEDTYQFTSKLKANVGLSFMNRSSDGVEQYNSTTAQISALPYNSNDAWNLQGLLQYELSDRDNLSLSVARKTRFATIKDRYSYRMGTAIPNPDLKAENALNYDLSYHGNPSDRLSLSVSGFYSKIDNSIQMVSNVARDPISNNNLAQVQNVGKAEYYGFEAGLAYQLLPNLHLDANYTRIIRNNLSAPQIKFTDVPGNKVFASVSYYVLPWVSLLASEEYNSNRFSTSYGTKAGSFYLTNAKINLALKHGISIEGGVNNAFDRNYRLVEGFPEAGRNYFANLIFNY